MQTGFATEHGGYVLKEPILEALRASEHAVQDFGAYLMYVKTLIGRGAINTVHLETLAAYEPVMP